MALREPTKVAMALTSLGPKLSIASRNLWCSSPVQYRDCDSCSSCDAPTQPPHEPRRASATVRAAWAVYVRGGGGLRERRPNRSGPVAGRPRETRARGTHWRTRTAGHAAAGRAVSGEGGDQPDTCFCLRRCRSLWCFWTASCAAERTRCMHPSGSTVDGQCLVKKPQFISARVNYFLPSSNTCRRDSS